MSKDANAILQDLIADGVGHDVQIERIEAVIGRSKYVIRLLAEDVGDPAKNNGAIVDPDKRQKEIIRVAHLTQMLEPADKASHEKDLAKAIGMRVTDFRDIVKTTGKTDEGEDKEKYSDPIYTPGGCINGHLVEILYDES